MKGAIKAVLFDLDNTLIDFMTMKTRCCEVAVRAMTNAGVKVNKKQALNAIYAIYRKVGMEDRQVFQRFLKQYHGKIDERILAAGIVAYRRQRIRHYDAYAGVIPTLKFLKSHGLKLGIVTDAPRLKAWMRLYASGLALYFDAVVTFEDTYKRKPARQPFLAAMKKLNVRAEQCVMIGDWPHRDIKGAKKMGMITVFAKYGNPRVKKSGSDYNITKIQDLKGLITKLK